MNSKRWQAVGDEVEKAWRKTFLLIPNPLNKHKALAQEMRLSNYFLNIDAQKEHNLVTKSFSFGTGIHNFLIYVYCLGKQ